VTRSILLIEAHNTWVLGPKNARALSVVLRRIAPQLRNIGITVKFGLGRKARDIAISRDQHPDAADD
jgi:hypothetical protein